MRRDATRNRTPGAAITAPKGQNTRIGGPLERSSTIDLIWSTPDLALYKGQPDLPGSDHRPQLCYIRSNISKPPAKLSRSWKEKPVKLGKKTIWWHQKLSTLRSDLKSAYKEYRALRTTDHWEAYKSSQYAYSKAVKKAKAQSWRQLLTEDKPDTI